jgi:hypothetical protein
MPGAAGQRPGKRSQLLWFVACWLAGVLLMAVLTGLLQAGMRLVR